MMRLGWVLVLVVACGETNSEPDPGVDASTDAGRDAGPMDAGPDTTICFDSGVCEPRPCEFVSYFTGDPEPGLVMEHADTEGEFSTLMDGGEAHAVWGFQGGIMLQPQLQIALDAFEEDLRCAQLEISHRAVDEESYDIPENVTRYEIRSSDPLWVYDQFSYGAAGVDGRLMDLEITVRTQTWARTTGVMQVTLVEGPIPD